jgi:hypothetical protein
VGRLPMGNHVLPKYDRIFLVLPLYQQNTTKTTTPQKYQHTVDGCEIVLQLIDGI